MDQRTGPPPDREAILATLRAHRRELEAMGVVGLALFGSVARGEAGPGSDIDLAVRMDRARLPASGFACLGHLDEVRQRLSAWLGRTVDVVLLPVHKPRLARELERDAVDAY
ncbi:nucleotidyltransferase family protein [Blastochloris sulfoviridis]|uniref:Polymerase nucleotidyl transferase domain-containing protein n=1 Tax=Blastochloris sulfoviridis TaxID=50712 RepID=A0A5M6HK49_9HYPH|nr:nucleotidyltransferase domain-containing protein [Blastochloris sulfoviridis]KAA5596252.1 hypothetical protein F1193_15890 [Blastochloris sulfoviridis]